MNVTFELSLRFELNYFDLLRMWPESTLISSWWRCRGQVTQTWDFWGRSSHFYIFALIPTYLTSANLTPQCHRRFWPLSYTPGVRMHRHIYEKVGYGKSIMCLTLTLADFDPSDSWGQDTHACAIWRRTVHVHVVGLVLRRFFTFVLLVPG